MKNMTIWFDGNYWGRHFHKIFIPQIDLYCNTFIERFLPTFDSIEEKAASYIESIFENQTNQRSPWDDYDISSLADYAANKRIEFFEGFLAVYQTFLNLSLVGLSHMYDQQLLIFYRKQLLHPSEENDPSKIGIKKLEKLLNQGDVDLTKFESWDKVKELRDIANVIKPAEGNAAQNVRAKRPDLFVPSLFREDEKFEWVFSSKNVYSPLTGDDIYVTIEDIKLYQGFLIQFWRELAVAIQPSNYSK